MIFLLFVMSVASKEPVYGLKCVFEPPVLVRGTNKVSAKSPAYITHAFKYAYFMRHF